MCLSESELSDDRLLDELSEMMGCVVHGESIWYAVVSVGILSDSSVECGSASVSTCGDAWKAREWVEAMGTPSIALSAMTTGVHWLTLVT